MINNQNQSQKKQTAVDMIKRMVGITDKQRAVLLKKIKLVPENKLEEIIIAISNAQVNIVRIQKEKNMKLKKINNELYEASSKREEAKELKTIESEIEEAYK